MRSVADFRSWAARQWRAHWPAWLAGEARPRAWPLHPPTEGDMAGDPDGVARWVGEWQRFGSTDGVEVAWVEKRWRAAGVQRLPERATARPEVVARLAGQSEVWGRAMAAAQRLRAAWPAAELDDAVREVARGLGRLDEPDAVRLLAVLGWLASHPDSGLWERELPVPDVHTKWLEQHRATVEPLVAAITDRDGTGLQRTPVRFRVRVLDPALSVGVGDFAVDLAGLRRLDWAPARVLICENATTLGTLPELPGVVAVHGMGFAAPTLAEVAWVRGAEQWYWGDLDTYGFQILGRVRAVLPEVRSVLMDAATLTSFAGFCVAEPNPFRGEIGYLSADERAALAQVRQDDRRLEQERIPREAAHAALAAVLGG